MKSAESFNPLEYWEKRLSDKFGLDGVGYSGMGKQYNKWMYEVRKHVFKRIIRKHIPGTEDKVILDVGSGTGFYVDLWLKTGAKNITGCDITSISVQKLGEKYPGLTFKKADITAELDNDMHNRFDAVSAFDVLFHIVDDAKYEQAIVNIHRSLKAGGCFIWSDNFLHRKALVREHQVSRTLPQIEAAVTKAGFEIVERKPMFILMNAPVDAVGRIPVYTWKMISMVTGRGEWAGWLAGCLLFLLELLLTRLLRESPTTEYMICRKKTSA